MKVNINGLTYIATQMDADTAAEFMGTSYQGRSHCHNSMQPENDFKGL